MPGKCWPVCDVMISLPHLEAGLLNSEILEPVYREALDLDLALETLALPPWDSSERASTVSHFLIRFFLATLSS